jgi:hypothetical protein
MKIQKQLIVHNPSLGNFGDCYRTCIAVMLDLNAADVPHFYQGARMDGDNIIPDKGSAKAIQDWLTERDIVQINVIFDGDLSVDDVLKTGGLMNIGIPFMFSGKSRLGCNHAVVAINGEIACDPSGNGIVGPCEDGYYWLTYLGKKLNPETLV